MKEESIFAVAIEKSSPEERAAYLDEACGGDAELRARVEALLQAHDAPDSLFQSAPDARLAATVDPPSPQSVTEGPGSVIANYRLLQQIGEGGFGVVYMAEQQRPVRRKVALKVIKPGMDSRAVVARFEAERQALALMDSPNIAHVLDGGATDAGRPYFVMELARGVPITDYCDTNQLSMRERLGLFATVCQAIQHAHQKGIIHRDLKPSNVLVTLHDDQPVVKVIDFGVSKAINQQLTEKTLFTAYGQMIGTPQYMSPEQAEMSGLDVDTRSDIYSLGVLLYELLTGSTPLEAERLHAAGYAEMQRLICEVEAPKPSTRLSTSGDKLTIIAQHRSATPERLHKLVRGDLDWIVMKALEKQRTRRYESASSLASDVQRFLNDELVEARPPSRSYRIGKFLRRNKAAAVATVLVVGALVAGTVATSIGLFRAQTEAKRANAFALELNEKMNELEIAKDHSEKTLDKLRIMLLDKALMFAISGDLDLTRAALEEARVADISETWEAIVLGHAHLCAGDTDDGDAWFARAVELAPDSYAAHAARVFGVSRDYLRYAQLARQLEGMTPSEPEDFLFKAQYEEWSSPDRALTALKQAALWRQSSLAHIVKAIALANRSLVSGDMIAAEQAVDQVRQTHARLPDNPMVLSCDLYVHIVAIHGARRQNRPETATKYLSHARELASELEPFAHIYYVRRTLAWLAADFGERDDAVRSWKSLLDVRPPGLDPMQFAAGLYHHRQPEVAAAALRRAREAKNALVSLALAYLMVLDDNRRAEVDEFCDGMLEKYPVSQLQCATLEVLLLAGKTRSAKERAERSLALAPGKHSQPYELVLQFVAGRLNPDDFCREFRALALVSLDADPDYYIGLTALGNGDRALALESFQACVDRHVFASSWYWWAKAFVARLRKDQRWPKWIDAMEGSE